jgi:hypothetical protein
MMLGQPMPIAYCLLPMPIAYARVVGPVRP